MGSWDIGFGFGSIFPGSQLIYGPYGPYMDFLPQIYGPYDPYMDFLPEICEPYGPYMIFLPELNDRTVNRLPVEKKNDQKFQNSKFH